MTPNSPLRLSVAIIARDEERHIAACLASVRHLVAALGGDVLVLLDSRSQDATATLAEAGGARVVRAGWRGFPGQRNLALALCRGEWVLFLDADERLTPALTRELLACLGRAASEQPAVVGYRMPRYNQFFGRTLRGGGWYPDYQLRLLHRTSARYDEHHLVHEVPHLDGATADLHQHLVHINIEYLAEFWQKQSRYALAEARILRQQGRRTRWRNYLGAPAREFWRRYVRLGGWRDGLLGLFLCGSLAWFEIVTFAMLALLAREHISPAIPKS